MRAKTPIARGPLAMRLSEARLRRCQTKMLYTNHRLPPWLTEDATPRSLEPLVSWLRAIPREARGAKSSQAVRPSGRCAHVTQR